MARLKGLITKHPVLFTCSLVATLTWLFVGLVIHVANSIEPATAPKKLDYSKPIFTSEHAIVCPASLLWDPSVDRGLPAVHEVFESFSDTSEKARAIGCETLGVSLPVYHAERMSPPFDEWVSISFKPNQSEELFTSQGDLTNGDPDSSAGSADKDQIATDSSDPTDPYKADRLAFQKALPSLEKPEPNLRWYPEPVVADPANRESKMLVAPYGPCASLTGYQGKYGVLTLDFGSNTRSAFLGEGNLSRDAAVQVAIKHCQDWYADLRSQPRDPVREQHIWFAPDVETAVSTGSNAVQTDTVAQQNDPSTDASQASEGSPAPIVRIQPLQRTTAANGDEVLSGLSGQCATLGVSPENPKKIQLTFVDGTTQLYWADERAQAEQAAAEHCQAAVPQP